MVPNGRGFGLTHYSIRLNPRYNFNMRFSSIGRAPWRVIIIQILLLSGLAVFFKLYLPRHARQTAVREAAAREQQINALFQNSVEQDSTQEISVPLDGTIVKRYPQKLRIALSPQDVESTLGVPVSSTTDFQGGQHLTWIGTAHKLEASFNAGRLYCLALEDRSTGHGVMVFESPLSWHPY
jgi:hypothetical protein